MKVTKTRYYADNNYQAYVVFIGRKPGIYFDWNSAKAQVHRFSGCKYKGYTTVKKAKKAFSDWQDENLIFTNSKPKSTKKMSQNSHPISADILEDLPWK